MTPRLKTSIPKKRIDLPVDQTKLIRELFVQNFSRQLKGKETIVEGQMYPDEILVRVGFVEKGALKQINFEASIGHSVKSNNALAQIYKTVDALGSMMEQYFKSEDELEFPKAWQEFKFENDVIYLQMSFVNSKLESEADRLLREADEMAAELDPKKH